MDAENTRIAKVKEVEERVAKMNATAVVQTIKDMHAQLAEFKLRLDQLAQMIAQLQNRFDTEKLLQTHVQDHGTGPTA